PGPVFGCGAVASGLSATPVPVCRCPVTADDEAESVLGLLRAHRGADGLRSLLQSAQTGARPQRSEIGAATRAVVADLETVRVERDDAASGAGVAEDVRTALAHAPGEELAQLAG